MNFNNYFFLLISFSILSQNINVNNDYNYSFLRSSILSGEIISELSLNVKPIESSNFYEINNKQYRTTSKNKSGSIEIKTLGIDYFIEFNSRHPYNRNNGTMIPNRGYQHIISPGIYFKTGPLRIQIKPEHHFSQNKKFDGFWEGHYPEIWAKRYGLWNTIDMPERFGNNEHNKTTLGQSSIRLNFKNISLGLSSENLWWGPSIRNSIMMSNHAQGFNHITLNTTKPIKTLIGNFEFQIVSGRLESSGYNPPNIDYEYAGTKLYVPKINQLGDTKDWRYMQGFVISYSPKFIKNLSVGLIRWVNMYSALVDGKYTWMRGNPSYFPAFRNLFRKNDKFIDYEAQTNQAAGIFLKSIWKDAMAEIYFEFHHNDSKQNLRDLFLDSDHSRASTIGLQKIYKGKKDNFLFGWEWTQMEQSASRLLRNAGSWYQHGYVYDGYTNRGEVLGSSIGPGSNSHFISIERLRKNEKIGIALEIIDNDNDFYHEAFATANDFRRYWKDINFHIKYHNSFKNYVISSNLVYNRSLNYQWELDDNVQPYYHNGNDLDNLHLNIKITFFGNW